MAQNYMTADWEDQDIQDKVALANALRKQSLSRQGQMVGNQFVAKSPWENLVEGLAGGYMGASARGRQAELQGEREKAEADWFAAKPTSTMQVPIEGPVQPGDAPLGNVTQLKPIEQRMNEGQEWAGKAPPRSPYSGMLKQAMATQVLNAPYQEQVREEAREARSEDRRLSAALRAQEKADQAARDEKAAKEKRKEDTDNKEYLLRVASGLRPPKEPKLQVIDTLDEQGRPVQKVVELKAGSSYAALPKSTGKESTRVGKEKDALGELMDKLDAAEQGLPYASGLGAAVPAGVRQAYTSENTKMADASVAALSAEKAHELYGAAFTGAERQRAAQFLPNTTGLVPDTTDTIKAKLKVLRVLAEKKQARLTGQPDPHPKMYDNILDPVTKPIGPKVDGGGTAPNAVQSFASESAAAAANLPKGTPIIINGVKGTWQ